MQDFLKRITSRKFLLAVGFAALVILNASQKWGLSQEDLTSIGLTVASFIGVEGALDFKSLQQDALDTQLEILKLKKDIGFSQSATATTINP